MIPVGLPESSLVAKLPSVATSVGPDQLDLTEEVRLAGLDLLRLRVAIARRAALEHVRDVDVRARQSDPVQELLEQLAGLADEGNALLILVVAGRLADEHHLGVRVA